MNSLHQKVAIITGAGSGLGKETAIAFAREGANVVICDRSYEILQPVEALIHEQFEVEVLSVQADVSTESDVNRLIRKVIAKFQRIDILINNAAIFQQYHIIDSPLDSWEYQINNNATSVFLMMREALPYMRSEKSGHIINITSGIVKEGAAGFGAYAASKAAIEALTYSVQDEEHRKGIKIHVFNPGVMKTNLARVGEHPANIAPYLVHLVQSSPLCESRVITPEDFQLLSS